MLKTNLKIFAIFFAGGILISCLFSCRTSDEPGSLDIDYEAKESSSPLEPVNFGHSSTITVDIDKNNALNVVLIKINKGDGPVNYADSGKIIETTGGSSGRRVQSGAFNLVEPAQELVAVRSALAVAGGEQGYVHYKPAWEFNNNPPRAELQRSAAMVNRSVTEPRIYQVGTTKNFWIDDIRGEFDTKAGKLLYSSLRADVWTLRKPDDTFYISETEATEMALKFDTIYGYETALLGYEYGGGQDGRGGVDGNPRVQILVYDIPQQNVAGYFWGKDAFLDGTVGSLRSNEAEIFYIDSEYYKDPARKNSIYSTLVHEFQHMIQFNLKTIKSNFTITASAWYNEMLSMLAEDIVSPLIGISASTGGHPAKDRFPSFLKYYWVSGITEHNPLSSNVLYHYSNNYGFGAYLIRNYGGAQLLREMIQNNDIDEKSILSAITAVNGQNFSGIQFDMLQKNLPAAMFNQSLNGYTFVKERIDTITGNNYTCYPISILDPSEEYLGTSVFKINTDNFSTIPARGFICESDYSWLGMDQNSENLSITISRPANANIKLYLLVL